MDNSRYRSVCLSALAFRQNSSILQKPLTKHGTNTNEAASSAGGFPVAFNLVSAVASCGDMGSAGRGREGQGRAVGSGGEARWFRTRALRAIGTRLVSDRPRAAPPQPCWVLKMKERPGLSMPFSGACLQGHPACPSQLLGRGEGRQGESNPTGEAPGHCAAHPDEDGRQH